VRGERPWSVVKIALAVLLALAILVPVLFAVSAAQRGGGGFSMGVPNVARQIEPRRTNWPQSRPGDLLEDLFGTPAPRVEF